MSTQKKYDMTARHYRYNDDYQKKYIRRYVFKLNTKHDAELIRLLENMENRSEWFKNQLQQELH